MKIVIGVILALVCVVLYTLQYQVLNGRLKQKLRDRADRKFLQENPDLRRPGDPS